MLDVRGYFTLTLILLKEYYSLLIYSQVKVFEQLINVMIKPLIIPGKYGLFVLLYIALEMNVASGRYTNIGYKGVVTIL